MLKTSLLVVLYVIFTLVLLGQFGVNIAPLLAGAGIIGLAIGFGAQELVRDVISGFFMILENQIRVGDIVNINGTSGLVEKIEVRIEAMIHNKVNIEFVTKQLEKALSDIENLKDKVRANGKGVH